MVAVVVIFAVVMAALLAALPRPSGAVNAEAASNCPGSGSGGSPHQYARNETLAGILQCAQVAISEISGNVVNSITKGAHTLTGAISFLNSTSIGIKNSGQNLIWKILNVGWGNLTAFPSACAANGFVSQIAATLTCTASSLVQGANTISGYSKTLLNSTSIGWDFRVPQNTILAKLLSQSCPANQFVNLVADTIGCATPSGDVASSPAACSAGDWLTRVIEDGAGALTLSCATVSQEASSSPAACGAGNALTQVTESAAGVLSLICSAFVSSANGLTGALTWAATSPITVASAGSTITYACPTCISSGNYVHLDADVNLATTTPTIVQNTFATFTTGTSGSKAFGSNLAAKNTVIVCEGQSGTVVLPGAPTDTLTLTYTSVASSAVASSLTAIQCWQAMSNAGGADTVSSGTYGITCTVVNVCTIFLNEISGSDKVSTLSTTGGTSSTSTSLVMTSKSYINSPLLLAFYQKATAGTDTAGTGFSLLNGETGSLSYLSEKNTAPTPSSSTTCPATAGTTTTYDGVCVLLQKATTVFSIALSANTNYVFNAYMEFTQAGGSDTMWLHQMDSGVTLLLACSLSGSGSGGTSSCNTSTDIGATVISLSPTFLWGTIKVGSTPTTLLIEFSTLTPNAGAVKAGSFIFVSPTN